VIVVVMGVAGAGKSTVGRMVADRLGVPFVDADEFHSSEDIAAMRAGVALDDEQRQPWLRRVHEELVRHRDTGCVVACSALKRSYRDVLSAGLGDQVFVALVVDAPTLAARLSERTGHFAGPALLGSQLSTLELGDDVVTVDGAGPPEVVAANVLAQLPSP
jgi:carbohydrate kinase (thermoresistant glucokinase family)